ncbi:MAG: hypothetical protein AAFY21_00425 [Cyanobacteria bacterium J06641_2]
MANLSVRSIASKYLNKSIPISLMEDIFSISDIPSPKSLLSALKFIQNFSSPPNGSSFSLRLGATLYLNYPDRDISILRDLYEVEEPPSRLSLRSKARFLKSFILGRKELIELWILSFLQTGNGALGNFKGKDGRNKSFAQIAAGLTALKDKALLERLNLLTVAPLEGVSTPYNPMPPSNFPDIVEQWIENEVEKHRDPGTEAHIPQRNEADQKKSYDFWLKEMVPILYMFENDPDLLSNRACEKLVDKGLQPLLGQKTFTTYEVTADRWLRALGWAASIGGAVLAAALSSIGVAFFSGIAISTIATFIKVLRNSLRYPETENHVLMTHVSIYLANDWVKNNTRGIAKFNEPLYSELALNNASGSLEDLVLQLSGRVTYSDFFETNARNYRSFSVQPLIMLASYAQAENVSLAARNALDFSSLKFGCQSIKGQQYSPFRRSYKKGKAEGLYTSNSFPRLMGALTTERAWDDPTFTILQDDTNLLGFDDPRNKWEPGARFTLWACLMSYRVPHVLLDFFSHHKDSSNEQVGYWTRTQARFSNDHYVEGQSARYFNDDGTIFQNADTFKVTPEFYFRTPEFLNSWGGTYDRYPVRFDEILARVESKAPPGTHEYDLLSRANALLFRNPPFPNWGNENAQNAMNAFILHSKPDEVWNAKSGCFKSLTYAVKKKKGDEKSVQAPWSEHSKQMVTSSDGQRSMIFSIYDLSTNNEQQNPDLGVFVIVCYAELIESEDDYARGFWEVLPQSRFTSAERLRDFVRTRNNKFASDQSFIEYHMTTDDRVRLSLSYPQDEDHPIIEITDADGQAIIPDTILAAQQRHQFPLIDVLEVDESYKFTGRRFAFSSGNGKVTITNRFLNTKLIIDSSDYRNPLRTSIRINS